MQANLAYVEYARLRDEPWDGSPSYGGRQLFPDGVKVQFADTSTWPEGRVRNRIEGLKKRLNVKSSDAATEWWAGLEGAHPPAVILRIVEELDARQAPLSELHQAWVDGATRNVAAALAYVDSTRARMFEAAQAARRANARYEEGFAHHNAGRYAEAVASYEAAIAERPDDATYYIHIADAWKAAPEPEFGRRFDLAVEALERGLAKLPKSELLLAALKKTRLLKSLVVRGAYQKNLDRYHMVTPLAVEVAASLIPLVEENGGRVFDGIGPMRERFRETMGLIPPEIRFRGNETDMPPDTYLLMLDEVPLVMETVPTVDGAVSDHALALLKGIETFIRKHLSRFITYDAVLEMLEKEKDAAAAGVMVTISEHPPLFSRLVRLLKALVAENVPIVALPALCRAFLDGLQAQADLDTLLPASRMLPEIRPQLPGHPRRHARRPARRRREQDPGRASPLRRRAHPVARTPTDPRDPVGVPGHDLGAAGRELSRGRSRGERAGQALRPQARGAGVSRSGRARPGRAGP